MILHKVVGSRFSEVVRGWEGETVAIIGGGPSVTTEDVDTVRFHQVRERVRCIAVNDAYLLMPSADIHYAADERWYRWHNAGVDRPTIGLSAADVRERWLGFEGQKCTIEAPNGHINEDETVHVLRNRDHPNHGWGLSFNPKAIATGRNSGFQALNIAALSGAKRILLLGFDGKAWDGKSHWFGEHPAATSVTVYDMFREAMSKAEHDLYKAGIEVFNCSPDSRIDTFTKKPLSELLP